jgi:hypothetical protein
VRAAGAAHPPSDTGTIGTSAGSEPALAGGIATVPLGAPGMPGVPLGAPGGSAGVDIKAPSGLGNNGWTFIEPPPVQVPPAMPMPPALAPGPQLTPGGALTGAGVILFFGALFSGDAPLVTIGPDGIPTNNRGSIIRTRLTQGRGRGYRFRVAPWSRSRKSSELPGARLHARTSGRNGSGGDSRDRRVGGRAFRSTTSSPGSGEGRTILRISSR